MSKVIVEPNVTTRLSPLTTDTLTIKKTVTATTSLVDTRDINEWGYEDIVPGLYAANIRYQYASDTPQSCIVLISVINIATASTSFATLIIENTFEGNNSAKVTYDPNSVTFKVEAPQSSSPFTLNSEISLLVRYNTN